MALEVSAESQEELRNVIDLLCRMELLCLPVHELLLAVFSVFPTSVLRSIPPLPAQSDAVSGRAPVIQGFPANPGRPPRHSRGADPVFHSSVQFRPAHLSPALLECPVHLHLQIRTLFSLRLSSSAAATHTPIRFL